MPIKIAGYEVSIEDLFIYLILFIAGFSLAWYIYPSNYYENEEMSFLRQKISELTQSPA